jgi:hypothetical protein
MYPPLLTIPLTHRSNSLDLYRVRRVTWGRKEREEKGVLLCVPEISVWGVPPDVRGSHHSGELGGPLFKPGGVLKVRT